MARAEEVISIIDQLTEYRDTHKLEFYVPYDFQKAFHNAKGSDGKPATEKALMAANQIGKTICGAYETAFHATGLYPDWWEGHRHTTPPSILVASNTNETTRDRCQGDLFGDPTDESLIGTGAIPKHLIGEKVRKPGVPNAYDSVLVKHVSGRWAKVFFRAYEQGPKKFMGYRNDEAWLDEECPVDVWSQVARGTFATGGNIYMTFTPEEGITPVVAKFINDIGPNQALIRATWDDAPHMTEEMRKANLEKFPKHEWAMRSKGEPSMGSGLVFNVQEEMVKIDPIEIPAHWPRINGIDFGWDHPFACAFVAWDRETDTVYVYDGYREQRALPAIHADAIKRRGDWIPISWPADGLQTEKGSGAPLAELYKSHGLNMFHTFFTNPPRMGEVEGKGGNSVEAGVLEMLEMMETGRFKVFSTVAPFFEEMKMYHRKDGKIVHRFDDFLSAVRYAVMFRRHAQTKIVRQPKQQKRRGISNW